MRTFINQQLYPGEFLLHKKYAATEMLLDLVWTHCNIAADIALLLLDRHEFDKSELQREFVIQAALLSDIGVYACSGYEWIPGQPASDKPYIQHGVIGAWILQQEGYSPAVIQVAHSHTGVGLTAQDIKLYGLQLPEADYVPRTQLQKLIAYALKFHSKAPKFKTVEDITNTLQRYGKEKVEKFQEWQQEFGNPDLTEIKAKYAGWHQSFEFQAKQVTTGGTSGPSLNSAGIAK
jgi:uncharacterized protein